MCGICGHSGQGEPDMLERMLERLVHRGPDEIGRHREPGVALGIHRLRVIDPQGGKQPVTNETSTVWAVMNGEIYNYRELREELINKGHRFVSQCDTEVLVHLYEEDGEGMVHRLRGMFAFALWDQAQQSLLLVRDRLGIKPLYYTVRSGFGEAAKVLFASELPSLLAAIPPPSLRPRAIADYLSLLYVPGPETLYEEIYELRPGELLCVQDGSVRFERYWRPQESAIARAWRTKEEMVEHLHAQLRDAVRSHLVSDVPLGLLLSGGVDSSALLAFMRREITGPIKTFSIGYDAQEDQAFNELTAAKEVAMYFQTDHVETRLQPDASSLLLKVVEAMAEPFADSSAIPTYLVSEVARRTVTVALSGIGGDEFFGGYPRYLGVKAASLYGRVPSTLRSAIACTAAPTIREGVGGRDYAGRAKRFLQDGHRSIEQQYLMWTSFLPQDAEASALTTDLLAACGTNDRNATREHLFKTWPSDDPVDRAMGLDMQTYLPDDLLRMGDRISMRHSLELRVPFCDHLLVGFAKSIQGTQHLSGWNLKSFLKNGLRGLLPPAVLQGPKLGFHIPLARWLREDLKEMVGDLLSESVIRRRGYVNPGYVQDLLREHDSGRRNHADQIYALAVLELWQRQQAC
ncbi:MAG: asparagine synthase (glutamine-hydrolyzing) [Nitrospirae bacterium]|nr:asparagine synthase (glutamine-hydrolyzing) [Nitrospirota bacterium]